MVKWGDMLDLPNDTGLVVAVDTETSGLHVDDRLPEGGRCRVAAVSLAWLDNNDIYQIRAYPFDQGVRDKLPVSQGDLFTSDSNLGESEWRALLGWLAQQKLVFHNAKFDLQMLTAGTRHWDGLDLSDVFHWDTMVAQKVLDPLELVGLKETATRLLDPNAKVLADQLDAAIKSLPRGTRRTKGAGSYDLVAWEDMEAYAAYDAELTIRLYYLQKDRLDLGQADPAQVAEEQELCRALYRIERRGLQYDTLQSLEVVAILRVRADKLKAQLPFTPSLAGAKHYFFTELGLAPYKTTDKTLAPKLDDQVQLQMIADKIPWAQQYADWTDLERAISMWYGGYVEKCGEDGRLRTNYRQTKVVSGRMSVERIQLQAIPKDDKVLAGVPTVRSLIAAPTGWALWNLDLSQAELRVATKYSKCDLMAEMLAAGADLHGVTTTEIFGVAPPAEHNYKTCHCEVCEDFNVKRDIAKRLTFGGIFQIGWKTFQATLQRLAGIYLPDGECQRIIDRWRRMYPEFGYAYRQAERAARDRGYVKLCGGRYRSYFGPRDFPNTAWNRVVQGSLAQFNKLWVVETERRLDPADGRIVLNVHDSLVLELVQHKAQTVAEREGERAVRMATEMFGIEMPCDVKTWGKDSEAPTPYIDFVNALK